MGCAAVPAHHRWSPRRCRRGRRRTAGAPVSVRPDPSRPAMPTTSPRRISRSSGATLALRPSPVACRNVGGGAASAVSCTSCSRASSTASSRPIIFDTSSSRGSSSREVLTDEAAVAQHGDAVGDAVHLIEEVGDEHHGHARRPHPLDHLEQLVDLASVEAGGGLVEDQHPGVHLRRPGDRHELLHGDRVRLERRRRVDVEVQLLEHLAGAPAHRRPVDAAEATTRLAPEHRVLRHRQVGGEVDLLVHGADAGEPAPGPGCAPRAAGP